MKEKKTRIWTGVGAYLLAGAGTAVIATQALGASVAPVKGFAVDGAGRSTSVVSAGVLAEASAGGEAGERHDRRKHHEGGEGGESGEAGKHADGGEGGEGGEGGAFAGLSPETEFLARLLSMKGHLRAGKDLAAAGDSGNAKHHFAHPLSEEYEEIAPRLDQAGLRPFKEDLVRLVDLAAAGADRAAVSAALANANAAIDDRIAAARGKAGDAGTYLAAITALLRKAAAEYGASIKQGRIADAEEYQDARGFILIVREEVAKANLAQRQKDARAAKSLGATLDRLAEILAEPVPPARAPASSSEVYGGIARAEIALNRLK